MSDEKEAKKSPSHSLSYMTRDKEGQPQFTEVASLFPSKSGRSITGGRKGDAGLWVVRPVEARVKDMRERSGKDVQVERDSSDGGHEP